MYGPAPDPSRLRSFLEKWIDSNWKRPGDVRRFVQAAVEDDVYVAAVEVLDYCDTCGGTGEVATCAHDGCACPCGTKVCEECKR